jgi:N-acetylneuraminate synthase/N,N'-diacetyllegionaminate synthase
MSIVRPDPWQGRHGPLLIAEIGGNHEGDFDAALRLTDLAIESGADVVKFQIYTGDTLVSPLESPDRHAHFERFELTPDQHLAIARRVLDAGLRYTASVWDPGALSWIHPVLDFHKIGSGDLTAFPILRAHARFGKPMVLSTGLATLAEVRAAIDFVRAESPIHSRDGMLALLQCTSLYPTPETEANLRVMDTLRAATGLTVGYSNHTPGVLPLLVAASRGAEVLEFHFTDRREGRAFRDHAISLTRDEVRSLVVDLQAIGRLLGSAEKVPTVGEIETGHLRSFRRAVYARRDLAAGEVLRVEDLVVLRPNHGVDARDFDQVVGRRVRRATPAFAALDLEDTV